MASGSQKLAVLLCKFRDFSETEPEDVNYFRELFVNRGTGGLNDFWVDASLGSINLDGSEVFGWRTLEQTQAEYISAHPDRAGKIQGAVDAFSIDRSRYAGIVALFNVSPGDSGAAGGVLGGPGNYNPTFLAHETGHLFGLNHSFDQSTRKTATWSAPGEYYDMHDIMSAMNVHSHFHPRFAQRGPLLCAANLDAMGWLPASRTWVEPISDSFTQCLDLVPLGHPEIPGYLAARVGNYYVEFRMNDRWDAGIPRPTILIHRMQGTNAVVMASDATNWVNDWQSGQSFGPSQVEMAIRGGIRIQVDSIDDANMKARLCITRQAGRNDAESVLFLGSIVVGDGWVLLRDVLYRVPPKGGPLHEIVDQIVQIGARRIFSEPMFDSHISRELDSAHRAVASLKRKVR